jgi:hypothetical protein
MKVKLHSNLVRMLPVALFAALGGSSLPTRAADQAPRYPFRLRLKVQTNTVKVGGKIPLIVEFLDRDYQPVGNDRDRVISFKQNPLTAGASGDISPSLVTVPANATSSSQAIFQGKRPGKVMIRAECEGLAPYETVVSVREGSVSTLARWFDFTVHAQNDEPPFQFCTRDLQPVPANGKSPLVLQVCLKDIPSEKLRVRIDSTAATQISYKDEPAKPGFAEFVLGPDGPETDVSGEIRITSLTPGDFTVQARVVGRNSLHDEIPISFLALSPASIILDVQPESVTAAECKVQLRVALADDAGTTIRKLASKHSIDISAVANRELLALSTNPLVLTPDPDGYQVVSDLEIKGFPESKELVLLAKDQDGTIRGENRTIKLNGTLPGIGLLVLLLLAGAGGLVGSVTRHLLRSHSKSFWPKRIHGRLKLGFVGNLPFSALFGAMLFLGVRFGVAGVGGKIALANLSHTDSLIFAGFIGLLGGFAGILVLDRLVDWVLPSREPRPAKARTAHG